MSQEKVERYKAEKANRKEQLRKEKRNRLIRRWVASAIAAVFVIWIGYSGVRTIQANIPRSTTEVVVSSVSDYITDLEAAESDEQEAESDDTDASDETADADSEE